MITVIFGTRAQATAVTSLAPSRGDAARLIFAPDHEAGNVLQEEQRDPPLAGELDEMRPLERRLGIEDAVIGEDGDRHAEDPGKAGDQRRAVELLELLELRAVDQPGDHLAHIIGPRQAHRHDAVELGRVVERRRGSATATPDAGRPSRLLTMSRTIASAWVSSSA